jgi:hypothetical protein
VLLTTAGISLRSFPLRLRYLSRVRTANEPGRDVSELWDSASLHRPYDTKGATHQLCVTR